jgi:hypothetical protein
MNYLLYFIFFLVVCYGVLCLINHKKEKRIFHVLAYIAPFWVWGTFFLLLSLIIWNFRSSIDVGLPFFWATVFFFKGIYLDFAPKRKIKKNIEFWENFPERKKRIVGALLIILVIGSFLI